VIAGDAGVIREVALFHFRMRIDDRDDAKSFLAKIAEKKRLI